MLLSELIPVSNASYSHHHLNDTSSLLLPRGSSVVYDIQSSHADTQAVVTITHLDSFRFIRDEKSRPSSYPANGKTSEDTEESQKLVFSSDASVLVDRESGSFL